MSRDLKKGEKVEKSSAMAEKVVVAVKASKEIPKTALVWALTHVVQPGDCITLLVVISSHSSGNNFLHILISYLLYLESLILVVPHVFFIFYFSS